MSDGTLTPASPTPMDLIQNAVERDVDVEVLERLMALQERWEANQGRRAYAAAHAAAKAEIPVIRKNRTVDFTSSKGRTHYQHEDFAEIARTVDPVLSKYGLSYRFRTKQEGGGVTVACILSHRDGYSEETALSAGADGSGNKNAIQGVGSTVTYLQRYTLKTVLGLAASDDDDGQASEAGAPITAEQVTELQELLTRAKAPVEEFCTRAGIEALADLPAADFDKAKALIDGRIKRMGGGNA